MRGLDEGISLARQCHATITGLYVVPLSMPKIDAQISYIEKELLKQAANFMEKSKKRAAENGILFDDKIIYGNEGPKIVNFAERKHYDLIVIGSRGMGSLKEIFLGSTSNFVLHKSKVPVLIVK